MRAPNVTRPVTRKTEQRAATETPWTWKLEHRAQPEARDFTLQWQRFANTVWLQRMLRRPELRVQADLQEQ